MVQATTDGLSMYLLWIKGDYCNPKSSRLKQQNYFTVSVGQKSRCCFAGSSCSGFLRSLHSHCPLGCQPSQGSTRGGSVLKLTLVAVDKIHVLGLVGLRVYETYHSTSSKHGPWLLSGPAREKAGESGQDACQNLSVIQCWKWHLIMVAIVSLEENLGFKSSPYSREGNYTKE